MNAPLATLAGLAQRFALELRGPGDARIEGVASLQDAGPAQVSFLANPQYRARLRATRAAAVVLAEADAADCPVAALVSRNPYADFARIAALYDARPAPQPGVHPSAVVAPDAVVEAGASIGPQCVVGARSRIAAGAELGPGCVVGDDCVVGAQSRLVARVTLVERVVLGQRVLVHPGAVLGADGFGLAMDGGRWLKVPQLGGVRIGDDCEIGANTTIDRGALGDTVLEEDVRLDNQIQIGHNCHIGAHTAMAGCVGVAGSTRIGRHCLVAGAAGISGHLSICDKVTISAMTMVTRSITEPGEYSSGLPMQDNRTWKRNIARFRHLDEIVRKLLPRVRELDNDE
ncbi:MAG TPA: UDP-3-O-(3-hydroxymyristoyl)glucosamine N-acyltransferase [Pseudomonadota bacterium]|nr:UDP-3-O-(3-hydroxymyristoyl)glucosamine N-acyltransferase [Pseudomonadota bacterium]